MNENQYIALIGDLVSSREITGQGRNRLQTRLTNLFNSISGGTHPGMVSQPLITLGDEFQALFSADAAGSHAVLDLIVSIVDLARPTGVRFGVGVGPLTTDLKPQALGMDGPCFHRARLALERSRATGSPVQIEIIGQHLESVFSNLASYALRQRAGWTEAQLEAITLYNHLGAWKKVAQELGVSQAAVSKRQQAAGWNQYRGAWTALGEGFESIVTDGPSASYGEDSS